MSEDVVPGAAAASRITNASDAADGKKVLPEQPLPKTSKPPEPAATKSVNPDFVALLDDDRNLRGMKHQRLERDDREVEQKEKEA